MKQLLSGKVCLITGAGQGIGKAMAKAFADNGAVVFANDIKNGSVEAWLEIEGEYYSKFIRPIYFDITNENETITAIQSILKQEKKIDVLVNNAAVEFNEVIGMISKQNLQKMFEVNVYGTINMLQIVSRVMRKNKDTISSIINIASLVGIRGNKGQLSYSATKGAVIALTKSAAKELAPWGIKVNAIAPGLTETNMMLNADKNKLQARIDNICMGRLAEPDDIAEAAVFFASELSDYVSGQVLGVDGCTII